MQERAPRGVEHEHALKAPPAGTVERWCFDFVSAREVEAKLAPAPLVLEALGWEDDPPERGNIRPGRPEAWEVVRRSPPAPKLAALADPVSRAEMLHRFVHHELQAAELFAWAVLAFPRTPREFRAGLLRLCAEELVHMRLYLDHLRRLDVSFGTYGVRDWFWERVPLCADPAAFVALQGIGLEGANLEHAARYAAQFRAAGDERGACILEQIEHDEIAHVAFAKTWFERFTGAPLTFEAWKARLPAPLTPSVLQGRPINVSARRRAGLDDAFLEALAAAPPTGLRRTT